MKPFVTCVALLALATLVAGCAGESLFSANGEGPDAAGVTTAGGFNPFAPPEDKPPGGREVIKTPTMADVMLTGATPEMAFGRTDAPVTIVKYASLTCPYCRRFHQQVFPELKRRYIDTGKVRFIMRDFPIGKTSGAATIALRCARPENHLELYGKFLAQQPKWVAQEVRLDRIFAVAAQVGMTRQQFDACRKNQAMIDGLSWVKDRGRTLGVIGTPNFFVGNKLVKKALTMEEISAMVEPLIEARAAAAKSH